MSVRTLSVGDDESGLRLDRWFRRHFPGLPHGRLEKLLRSGQIRVDSARARANTRLQAGQRVRVPPLGDWTAAPPIRSVIDPHDAQALTESVLYRDDDIVVINKPPGLAVQGGSGVSRHLDGMLDVLRFGARERPRLVHRLDKDTSGALVLAGNANSAARLAAAFRDRSVRKYYWALVVGNPSVPFGEVDIPLSKKSGRFGEKVVAGDGRDARTRYAVIESAGREASWLVLELVTGRTHQLRAHLAAIGTPIQGDGKYGGRAAFLMAKEVAPRLHLHAREVHLERPGGRFLQVKAPLPDHMASTWAFFGFDPNLRSNSLVDGEG